MKFQKRVCSVYLHFLSTEKKNFSIEKLLKFPIFCTGFDRSIPGFPRYQMVGDANLGVHNLRILDVNLSDDAEYQCQVTPMLPSEGIRHSVNVTVLSE